MTPRQQQRHVCRGCDREWVYSVSGNERCPGCGSTEIELVTFTGQFDRHTPPGVIGAIDEREQIPPPSTARAPEILPPPMALTTDAPPRESAIPEFR